MNFRCFSCFSSNFAFFLRIFDESFSGFRAKFQKRVTFVAFQPILRKQIRKLPNILKSVKIIQYYSILFNRVLSDQPISRAVFRLVLKIDFSNDMIGYSIMFKLVFPFEFRLVVRLTVQLQAETGSTGPISYQEMVRAAFLRSNTCNDFSRGESIDRSAAVF